MVFLASRVKKANVVSMDYREKRVNLGLQQEMEQKVILVYLAHQVYEDLKDHPDYQDCQDQRVISENQDLVYQGCREKKVFQVCPENKEDQEHLDRKDLLVHQDFQDSKATQAFPEHQDFQGSLDYRDYRDKKVKQAFQASLDFLDRPAYRAKWVSLVFVVTKEIQVYLDCLASVVWMAFQDKKESLGSQDCKVPQVHLVLKAM